MLVLHTSATEGRLRFVSMQSGSVREVVLKNWPMLRGVDWSADSKMVFIGTVTPNNVPVVLGVDIEGGSTVGPKKATITTRPPEMPNARLSVSQTA